MQHELIKQEAVGMPEPLSEDADLMFYQHYSIFYASLKEAIAMVT